MQPFEINIDELKEKQDMWLLYPDKNKMDLKISNSENPKNGFENWSLYVQQHWKNKNGPTLLTKEWNWNMKIGVKC